MKYLESIQETIYLSAGNAPQYRRIMRIFFTEYERMHFQLYKEDVLELLREYPEFSDYSMEQIDRQDLKEVNEWWSNLQEDFKRLNRNYQDYLREFYSGKSDKMLKSIEFVIHKDRFISYLQEFVQQLQNKSIRIENTIEKLSQQIVDRVLERVIESELAIPHPDSEIQDLRENAIKENIYGKWQSLSNWFVPTDKHPSESQKVMDITDEVIRKIIQNAALIVQIQNWGISRKEDYKKFMQMFAQCENVEEAHKLSAHVFGIQHVRHFRVNLPRSTDSINSGVFDEPPSEYELKPHTRTYKPRIHKSGFESKALEKLAQRNQYLKKLEEDRKQVAIFYPGLRYQKVLP